MGVGGICFSNLLDGTIFQETQPRHAEGRNNKATKKFVQKKKVTQVLKLLWLVIQEMNVQTTNIFCSGAATLQ